MPYPESCPECGSTFRNTGTHFTARRNEVGRHVLLELGCQNTTRRFWWDFTTGSLTEDGRPSPARRATLAETVSSASNGSHHAESNGHASVSMLEVSETVESLLIEDRHEPEEPTSETESGADADVAVNAASVALDAPAITLAEEHAEETDREPPLMALAGPPPAASGALRDAFVRQLQLDRLTLRQMRSWLMSDEARRAIEVAAGATEATYERLALILFGIELPQLLGKPAAAPQSAGMSAEERLELQREKARIRARLRRAAAKAARQGD